MIIRAERTLIVGDAEALVIVILIVTKSKMITIETEQKRSRKIC
jgi:hypothetical protein